MKNTWKLLVAVGLLSAAVGASSVYAAEEVQNTKTEVVQDVVQKKIGDHKMMIGKMMFNDELLQFLNITREQLAEQLKGGKTLKQIAEAQGKTEQQLKDFLIEQHNKHLEQMKAEFPERVDKWINGELPMHPGGHKMKFRHGGAHVHEQGAADGQGAAEAQK